MTFESGLPSTHAGRPVHALHVRALHELPAALPSGAVVLIWLEDGDEYVRRVLSTLAAIAPLAVLFGGNGAEQAWDAVLVAADGTRTFVTWSESDFEEAVEDLLFSVFPFESRWDEWTSYAVVRLQTPENA